MAKKDKEIKKLRREVEILRAQLKGVGGLSPEVPRSLGEVGAKKAKTRTSTLSKQSSPSASSSKHIRTDLRRSLLITIAIFAIIGGLTISQSYWPKLINLAIRINPF